MPARTSSAAAPAADDAPVDAPATQAPAAPSYHATAQVMHFIATQEVHINGAVQL